MYVVVMKFSEVSHGGIENRKDWEEKLLSIWKEMWKKIQKRKIDEVEKRKVKKEKKKKRERKEKKEMRKEKGKIKNILRKLWMASLMSMAETSTAEGSMC